MASLYSLSYQKSNGNQILWGELEKYSPSLTDKEANRLTFFWMLCPSGFSSLLAISILLRTIATSFLNGSAISSSSWLIRKINTNENVIIEPKTNLLVLRSCTYLPNLSQASWFFFSSTKLEFNFAFNLHFLPLNLFFSSLKCRNGQSCHLFIFMVFCWQPAAIATSQIPHFSWLLFVTIELQSPACIQVLVIVILFCMLLLLLYNSFYTLT